MATKKTTYKGMEIIFNEAEEVGGLVYLKYGDYIDVIPVEEFNNLTIENNA